MKVYTCVPKDFVGNDLFFARDTGLICKGLIELGHESKAILLGDAQDDDYDMILRSTLEELESANWWKNLNIDACVLCSWGNPLYYHIAAALSEAGIKTIQITDTQGTIGPLSGFRDYLKVADAHLYYKPKWWRVLRTTLLTFYGYTIGWVRDIFPRRKLFTQSEVFAAASPAALVRFQKIAGSKVREKIKFGLIPFAIADNAKTDQALVNKEDIVIAVGRWSSLQKRQFLLMETIELTLSVRKNTNFLIYGEITPALTFWHEELKIGDKARVHLEGLVTSEVVFQGYGRSRVMLCASAYEGCHNASAEALSMGCSIVAVDHPSLSALKWHTSRESGQLSLNASPSSLSNALASELEYWDTGKRKSEDIVKNWNGTFNPTTVAQECLVLLELSELKE